MAKVQAEYRMVKDLPPPAAGAAPSKGAVTTGAVSAAAAAIGTSMDGQVVTMHAAVPGRQTVPRAELWAMHNVLRCMSPQQPYEVFIDDAYIINGLTCTTRHYVAGENGDIWHLAVQVAEQLEGQMAQLEELAAQFAMQESMDAELAQAISESLV